MSRLKILYLAEGLGVEFGGPGMTLPSFCSALAARNHIVTLATVYFKREKESPKSNYKNGLQICRFPGLLLKRWRFSPSLFYWLIGHADQFDIIHLNSLYSFVVLSGSVAARLHSKPYVLMPHGTLAPFQRTISERKKLLYDWLFSSRILNNAAAIIFTTDSEANEVIPLRIRAPFRIVPPGIEFADYQQLPKRGKFREKWLQGYNGPLILYLGRLNAKKGIEILVPAFAKFVHSYGSAVLAIVGSGDPPDYGSQIIEWVNRERISSNVVLTGPLIGEEKLTALADADVFVLTSRAENFATAMFEAMASRLPVVITKGLNMYAEIQKANAGIVVDFDIQQIASAMLVLISNPQQRIQMGENAYMLARLYSWENTAARLEALYDDIIRDKR